MSYQVLARKWRPRSFEQVAGQSHVLQALVNGLNSQRLHHAYLFTGTRGTGKTTLARILAKALNCEKGISAVPCQTCMTCQEIDAGRFVDLIEIDAASRTKVEDTRDILATVQYAPAQGRFKVYLIDEIHMLSTHSFNALLKTLEEPPPHVKFIFATTDPQKLPATVLSRCIQFNLKNLLPEQIIKQLSYVLTEEHIAYEETALWHIARAANGSMRDALSLLDQAIAYSNHDVKEISVRQMLGYIERENIVELLSIVANKTVQKVMEFTAQLTQSGVDFIQILDDMMAALHQITILQNVAVEEGPEFATQALAKLAETISKEDIQLFYQIALTGKRDLPLAPTERIGFEMTLLRMMAFRPAIPLSTQQTRNVMLPLPSVQPVAPVLVKPSQPEKVSVPLKNENTSQLTAKVIPAASVIDKPEATKSSGQIQENVVTKASVKDKPLVEHTVKWNELLPQLKLTGITQALAQHAILQELTENSAVLLLDIRQASILNDTVKARLVAAFSEYFQRSMAVTIEISKAPIKTPATLPEDEKKERLSIAMAELQNDPQVKNILQQFDGTIVPESITQ